MTDHVATFAVEVDVTHGPCVVRTVRAPSAAAAYELVCHDLEIGGTDTSGGCRGYVSRRRGPARRVALLVTPGRGRGDDGLAGVREPRRPKPSPPSLSMQRPLPHA